jgi:hypothetical protein
LFSGALLFVQRGTRVPAGYTRIGSFRQVLNGDSLFGLLFRYDDDRNGRVIVIDIYRKN